MNLPPPLSWLWSSWKKFSHVLGLVMSTIILTVLWMVGIGIYAIAMKAGRLFQSGKEPATWWVAVPEQSPQGLERQF